MKVIVRRFGVVILFLVIAIFVCKIAPEYDLEYKYKEGDIRVIFNDVEITRDLGKLPQTAILVDGEVMLSQDTVDILFDKNLYYEEKYNTLITTTKSHRADLEVDSKIIKVDDKTERVKVPPMSVKYFYNDDERYNNSQSSKKGTSEDVIYIPIKALEEVYDMTVEFKDKVIITENNEDRIRIFVKDEDTIELKYTKDSLAKNVETINQGGYIDIYNYKEENEFSLARSEKGELGYVGKDELKGYELTSTTVKKVDAEPEKLNIAWDYIGVNATSIGTKGTREKYTALDVVAPTLLYLRNTKGNLRYNSNVAKEYMSWANSKGYRVWATVKNEYADKHFSLSETSDFLNDMKHRETAINELIKFAKEYKIDGINVDFEYIYEEDATAFSQFIRELVVKAKKENILISVCVNVPDGSGTWSLCYQHKALSEYADYLALMTYDQYGASSKIAGPNASLDWVSVNVKKIVEREKVDSRKILLGIPFYSRLWKINGGVAKSSTLFMDAAKAYKGKGAVWQEDAGQYYYENNNETVKIWIEDEESIAKKLSLIEEYDLGGSAYWMLSYETKDVWKTILENTNY